MGVRLKTSLKSALYFLYSFFFLFLFIRHTHSSTQLSLWLPASLSWRHTDTNKLLMIRYRTHILSPQLMLDHAPPAPDPHCNSGPPHKIAFIWAKAHLHGSVHLPRLADDIHKLGHKPPIVASQPQKLPHPLLCLGLGRPQSLLSYHLPKWKPRYHISTYPIGFAVSRIS